MKKLVALTLAIFMTLSVVACSNTDTDSSSSPESALSVLNAVWDTYGENEKFPVAGGDFSEENANMEGPGKYSTDDAEMLDSALGYPAADIDKIDDAASLTHMMNANNFTCAVYHVNNASADDVAAKVKSNIDTRQWMCGFPEKLFIATMSDYVVTAFGSTDFIDPFILKFSTIYPDAVTVCNTAIA